MEQFFVFIDEKEQGPFTIDQLASMDITPETDVWTQGMDDWQPAGDVPALTELLQKLQDEQQPHPQEEIESPQVEVLPTVVEEDPASQVVVSEPEKKNNNKPPYIPDEPMSKKTGCVLWTSIVMFIVMLAMMFTVPSRKEHLEAVCDVSHEWVTTQIDESAIGGRVLGDVAKWVAGLGAEIKIKQMFRYKNYFFCSCGFIKHDHEETMVSLGIFGHVFMFAEEELSNAIKDTEGNLPPLEMATDEPTVGEDALLEEGATDEQQDSLATGEQAADNAPKDGKEAVKEAAKEILDSAAQSAKREAMKAAKEYLNKKLNEL